jgi:hypothetical protein
MRRLNNMNRNTLTNIMVVLLFPFILMGVFLEPCVTELVRVVKDYSLENVSKQIGKNWEQFKNMYFDLYEEYFDR